MSDLDRDWEPIVDAEIDVFAAAWYRFAGFRKGHLNPRWEFADWVIQKAWWDAAKRYVEGGRLREPKLRMEPRYAPDGARLNDEWVELP